MRVHILQLLAATALDWGLVSASQGPAPAPAPEDVPCACQQAMEACALLA